MLPGVLKVSALYIFRLRCRMTILECIYWTAAGRRRFSGGMKYREKQKTVTNNPNEKGRRYEK